MKINHEYIVVAVHGEGDRATVNSLQQHRNDMEVERLARSGVDVSNMMADESPDVMIILRDDAHDKRIEHPVHSWEEVEQWKKLIGWNQEKRHWQLGARVKVGFSV